MKNVIIANLITGLLLWNLAMKIGDLDLNAIDIFIFRSDRVFSVF